MSSCKFQINHSTAPFETKINVNETVNWFSDTFPGIWKDFADSTQRDKKDYQ